MGRLILVGEAPGGSGDRPRAALDPNEGSGKRLREMLVMSPAEFEATFERHNLFNTPDEGKHWNYQEATRRAECLAHSLIDGDRVILLGSKVAWAFDLLNLPYFKWSTQLVEGGSVQVAFVPHPSGRNRVLNDPTTRGEMRRFIRAAIRGLVPA